MMKKILTIPTLAILLLAVNISAQEQKIKKANEDFDSYAYIDARKIYLNVVEDGYSSPQVYKKLGDTYYYNSEYAEAAKWYQELIKNYPDQTEAEYYYRFAQTLKSTGKYEEAEMRMAKYIALSGGSKVSKNYSSNPISFEELTGESSKKYSVQNITNGLSGSDFSPTFYGNKIVFASSSQNTEGGKIHEWTGQPYTDLFEATVDQNGINTIQPLNGDINSPYNESSAVFTKDGNTIYFTRNNYINGKKKRGNQRLVSLKIYKATKNENGIWTNVTELPFNSDSYSVAHPALNADETRLYFSSNMNGTLGESDIWYVDILANGSYGTPVNLGSQINTEERETFPFISDRNNLYFSSVGHMGLGGLDIFVVSLNQNGDFKNVTNLMQPINSNQDDFGFIINEEKQSGYLSSNREGNGGSVSDDIYSFVENCNITIKGIITDAKSNLPLEGSLLTLLDRDNKVLEQQNATADGSYSFTGTDIDCDENYSIRATFTEMEYLPNESILVTPPGKSVLKVDLALTPPDCPVGDLGCRLDLQPIYFNLDKDNIRADAEVELAKIYQAMKEYPQLRIHIESHTDSRGSDAYNMQLSERRAKSTMNWLVNKGIAKERLTAKGYGESVPVNECKNGANCTEDEFQLNRRSMFIIKN